MKNIGLSEHTLAGRSRRRRWVKSETRAAYLFLFPSLLTFIFFMAIPIVFGFFISFTDYSGFALKFNFVGLDNYLRLFEDSYFSISLKNNVIYMLVFTPVTLLVAMACALLLNSTKWMKKLFQTTFFLPYITSMVSVAILWKMMLANEGPVNHALGFLGVTDPPQWLTSTAWAMISVIIVSVWKSFGYYMVILLAGLQSIPEHLYEAASIDGAGKFRKLINVTLPSLSPTIFLCVIMLIINSFQAFDLINVMTAGGPGRSTNVIVMRIYQEGFRNANMSYASAMAFVLAGIIMVVTLIQFWGQKKWVNYDK